MDSAELKISIDCFDVSTVDFHLQYNLSIHLLGRISAVWVLVWPCRCFVDVLGTGSLRRGTRCAQPSVACSLNAAEFEGILKLVQFRLLSFLLWSLTVSVPKLLDLPCKTELTLSDRLCCWVIVYDHFYQNTFLLNGLNRHSCPRMWLCQPGDGYQTMPSALSSWKHVQGLAVIGVWGWACPKGVQIQ